jgi:hypothetical protein
MVKGNESISWDRSLSRLDSWKSIYKVLCNSSTRYSIVCKAAPSVAVPKRISSAVKKYNWIIDPVDINATPVQWGIANGVKFDAISVEEHTKDDWAPYKAIRAAKQVKYIAAMTEADAAAFKLFTNEMSIKKARW